MKYSVLLLVITFLVPFSAYAASDVADAKVTVKVLDEENGCSLEDADIVFSFSLPKTMNPWDGTKDSVVKGKTDTNGMFSASSSTLRKIHVAVARRDYYRSSTYYSFKSSEEQLLRGEKWQPWNPTLGIRLRKKVEPVPLKAKWLYDLELPPSDVSVGYDLVAGDWVAPHGKGVEADLAFSLVRNYKSSSDYALSLTIATTGKNDGLVGIPDNNVITQSELRFPRQAPETGYGVTNILVSQSSSTPTPVGGDWFTRVPSERHFFFRVRTELDDKGQIKKALYGKLVGPIECSLFNTKTGKFRLTYYVNPDPNDRNLEFDPKRNLFNDLKSTEQVTAP